MIETRPYGLRTTEETIRLLWEYQGLLQAKRRERVTVDGALASALRVALTTIREARDD